MYSPGRMEISVYDPKHSEVFPRHSSHVRHVGLEQMVVGEGVMVFCYGAVTVAVTVEGVGVGTGVI